MNPPGGWELVLVAMVIMVLFGAKRLPEASRSLGRSLRIFKAETKGLRDDDPPDDRAQSTGTGPTDHTIATPSSVASMPAISMPAEPPAQRAEHRQP